MQAAEGYEMIMVCYCIMMIESDCKTFFFNEFFIATGFES